MTFYCQATTLTTIQQTFLHQKRQIIQYSTITHLNFLLYFTHTPGHPSPSAPNDLIPWRTRH